MCERRDGATESMMFDSYAQFQYVARVQITFKMKRSIIKLQFHFGRVQHTHSYRSICTYNVTVNFHNISARTRAVVSSTFECTSSKVFCSFSSFLLLALDWLNSKIWRLNFFLVFIYANGCLLHRLRQNTSPFFFSFYLNWCYLLNAFAQNKWNNTDVCRMFLFFSASSEVIEKKFGSPFVTKFTNSRVHKIVFFWAHWCFHLVPFKFIYYMQIETVCVFA